MPITSERGANRRSRHRKKERRMTLTQYFATPETLVPQEVVFGGFRAADAPFSMHQRVVARLFVALHDHVEPRALGEVWLAPLDVILDPDEHAPLVVQPDLCFIARENAAIVRERVWGPPDLVIEVLSPRPRIGELAERLVWFATYGVRECWLVQQSTQQLDVVRFDERRIAGQRTFERNDRIESAVLPAFERTLDGILRGRE